MKAKHFLHSIQSLNTIQSSQWLSPVGALMLVVLVVLVPSRLCAAPNAPAAAAPVDPKTEEATAHFRRGTNAYRAGLLDEAVTELRAAVLLKPTPNGIFALGQALREKGELSAAAHQYRQYLTLAPTGPFAQQSKQFLQQIEATQAQTRAAQSQPPRGVPPDPVAPPPPSTPPPAVKPPPADTPPPVAPVAPQAATPPPSDPSLSAPPPERKKTKAWVWGVVGASAVLVVGVGVGVGLALGLPPSNPKPTNGSVELQ